LSISVQRLLSPCLKFEETRPAAAWALDLERFQIRLLDRQRQTPKTFRGMRQR
jgi:hypothetical protein